MLLGPPQGETLGCGWGGPQGSSALAWFSLYPVSVDGTPLFYSGHYSGPWCWRGAVSTGCWPVASASWPVLLPGPNCQQLNAAQWPPPYPACLEAFPALLLSLLQQYRQQPCSQLQARGLSLSSPTSSSPVLAPSDQAWHFLTGTFIVVLFSWEGILLCCSGCALKLRSTCLSLGSSWDYSSMPLHPAGRRLSEFWFWFQISSLGTILPSFFGSRGWT